MQPLNPIFGQLTAEHLGPYPFTVTPTPSLRMKFGRNGAKFTVSVDGFCAEADSWIEAYWEVRKALTSRDH